MTGKKNSHKNVNNEHIRLHFMKHTCERLRVRRELVNTCMFSSG